jgi:hypothetical protein
MIHMLVVYLMLLYQLFINDTIGDCGEGKEWQNEDRKWENAKKDVSLLFSHIFHMMGPLLQLT